MRQTASEKDSFGKSKIDRTDRLIVNLLLENCRRSYNKIAAKVGVSVGTAYNRIKVLESKGIIKGYSLLVNSAIIGYSLTALIFLQVEGEHLSMLERKIAESQSVVAVYDVTGEFDALVIAKFKDREGLSDFIKNLAGMPHVKRTVTSISLATVKEDFRIKLP